ncbi:glycoside hydrolase family 2 TIM barrel-domain containing protein [Microbacter margulisiae]|uniref:Beta-galactosidase n=1 Tax=Microbacter margulisiae TaxID=1350067 RepID=A0A7W5H1Z1_9PORP|nr:glycoside hydrolase family 2 TIM barrel-domain containing protein [Microbacter margulisiae]MBB3188133.1 beta-galactosidase [Microbacter margulisiae]
MSVSCRSTGYVRQVNNFDEGWRFHLGDTLNAQSPTFNDAMWRKLDLPHDWSIEGRFDRNSPAGAGGGYLNGGLGWYRKTFTLSPSQKGKKVFIDFDGVYRNSTVWINGHELGFRPYGYISFRYDLTPYLHWDKPNVIAVKVDNSQQPNSRWYSGSGIYRNVHLVFTHQDRFAHWGIYVTTPEVSQAKATVKVQFQTKVEPTKEPVTIQAQLYDAHGKLVASAKAIPVKDTLNATTIEINTPHLWSTTAPYLYTLVSSLYVGNKIEDQVSTSVGIRYFNFDVNKGFSLNGKPMKILGVCDHHDLGCLGSAVNKRAIERQLEILKNMGCNAIRTSHNPPAPELLDLADHMGFLIMDEAFDMWMIHKTKYDYSRYFAQWHKEDLSDQIRRDRNHPSVIIWSVGNEIPEQAAKKGSPEDRGAAIMKELCSIVRGLDDTRPIVTANSNPEPTNPLISCGATDLIGMNYHIEDWLTFPKVYPGKKLIITESTSALETRGWYRMPSDSIIRVPKEWNIPYSTPNHLCSAYDNTSAPWGSTHEETWKVVKAHPYISGMFIWTGFDYIGEPTPYTWPSRSSYFGIIDLAGFPKDVYYMYQSEWTHKTVLHIFPHWNWKPGQMVDIWCYYNNADEVELFLNGKSLGKRHKTGDELHVMWSVPFEPGVLKAVSYKNGKAVKMVEERTAGPADHITLAADRNLIHADNSDLSFVTVKITDKNGTMVPTADNLVHFTVTGPGKIVGVDNGSEIDHDPFKANYCHAFFGKCLVVIQSTHKPGVIHLTATSEGLPARNLPVFSR